jgi:hypothetical protein
MRLIKAGDNQVFDRIYKEFYVALKFCVEFVTKEQYLADTVTQETLAEFQMSILTGYKMDDYILELYYIAQRKMLEKFYPNIGLSESLRVSGLYECGFIRSEILRTIDPDWETWPRYRNQAK